VPTTAGRRPAASTCEVTPTLTQTLVAALGGVFAGVLVAPMLRARIFRHAVPAEQWVRHDCPCCGRQLVRTGWRGVCALLPPTGRCPGCRRRIGPPAGSVEAVAGVVVALLALVLLEGSAGIPGPVLELAALAWVAAFGVALGFIDLAVHRLPDRLTLPAYGGALVLFGAAALVTGSLGRFGLAVLFGWGMALAYLLLVIAHPAGMGLGDVKLALPLGLALGWFGGAAVVLGAAAGFLIAGVVAVVLLALRRVGRRDSIAHGPAMLLGAFAVVLLVG
jgi:leader peptidase (prepilin peptidase) / N-methyltransferase